MGPRWCYFWPRPGVVGRLRRIPSRAGGGAATFGVELAASAEGPWIYNFDVLAEDEARAVARATAVVRRRFAGRRA